MRNTAAIIIILTALSLSTAGANPGHDQVFAMSESARAKALTQFLHASSEPCGSVNRTFYQGSTRSGDAVWHLGCSNGEAYALTIKNDAEGSTKLLNCKVLKRVKAGECFKK